MYKFFFLINPISGGGQGKVIHQFLPEIMQSMEYADSDWKVEFTQGQSMKDQILEALASTETLIAVGGDGTVSAVLSNVLNGNFANKVKIGLIPLGTGNDLARVLNLYRPFVDQGLLYLVRRLVCAKARPFDIWMVNGKYALANYFSGGIDARIAHDFNMDRATGAFASKSVFANKVHYVRRFFADRKYLLKKGTLAYQDERGICESVDLTGHRTVIVGNIPSFAGGANPFLDSNMADGLLEVVDVPNMFNFLMALGLGGLPLVGNFFKKNFLKSRKVKSVRLILDDKEYLQLDGEDMSGLLGGDISIEFASRVQMLALGE